MKEKKITKDEIRRAIIFHFGSIEKYAEHIGTKRQNVYDKITNRSDKFLKELKDNGVILEQTASLEIRVANLEKDVTELKAKLYDLLKDKM
jgi:hypothetical protein